MSNYTNDCDPIMYHLAKIVDMYLDEEQDHYQESVAMDKFKNGGEKNHIFHDLLAVSHWLKEKHIMINYEEVPDEDLWQDGELDQCEKMAKIEENLYIGKYKLMRKKYDR